MKKILLTFLAIAIVAALAVFGQNTPSSPNAVSLSGNLICCQNKTVGLGSFGAGSDAWLSNVYFNGSNYFYIGNGRGASIENSFGTLKIRLFANNVSGPGAAASAVTVFSVAQGAPLNSFTLDTSGNVTIPAIKSTTLTRYVCVDTTGKLVSSATACSGT